jgi:hypothetical protein
VACQPVTRAAFCCVPGGSQEIESILQRLYDLFPYRLPLCPTAHISFQGRLSQVYLLPPDYPGHLRRRLSPTTTVFANIITWIGNGSVTSLMQNAYHPACEKVTEVTGEGAFAKDHDEWEVDHGFQNIGSG